MGHFRQGMRSAAPPRAMGGGHATREELSATGSGLSSLEAPLRLERREAEQEPVRSAET